MLRKERVGRHDNVLSVIKYCVDDQLGHLGHIFAAYLVDNEAVCYPVNHPSDHRLRKRVKMSPFRAGSVQF